MRFYSLRPKLLFTAILLTAVFAFLYIRLKSEDKSTKLPKKPENIAAIPVSDNAVDKDVFNIEIPLKKVLVNDYHTFQTFNNCGPASLSMTLSYYGIALSQKELGDDLRPYQIASGDNDDKSVTLSELAEKSKEYGLIPYHRPGGNPDIIKKFIAINIPVITRTWTKPEEDIGHYRVIKGYDNELGVFIQDDSLQGKNLKYSYSDFEVLWEKFSNEFLVLIPKEKVSLARNILGEISDEKASWQKAISLAEQKLTANPNDANQRLNLSVALYHTGNLQRSVQEFEIAENGLPMRALWYQIEPIRAYYELGNYDRVFEVTNKILERGNRAYSEVYIIRGDIYQTQGNVASAKAEYEKAVYYNKNLTAAKNRLQRLAN